MSHFSLKNIHKKFGNISALKNFSLNVEPGERVAVLGCNGAGKSTFLNIAIGLRPPTSGEISILGQSEFDVQLKSQISFLPQELSFPATLKVKEILELAKSHYPNSSYADVAESIGLSPLFNRKSTELSGGEKRKLALTCVLLGQPKILLLDEPTANIDLIGKNQIYGVLEKQLAESNQTLIFSSHQMSEVEKLADRVVVLDQGEIFVEGSLEKIKNQFGLKKISFQSDKNEFNVISASSILNTNNAFEVFGVNGDKILKECLCIDPNISNIKISEPSLEEIFINIWRSQGES